MIEHEKSATRVRTSQSSLRVEREDERTRSIRDFDSIADITARATDPGAGDSHAAALRQVISNRTTAGRRQMAQQSILRLQRTHGNRHVQRVLALARKAEGEGEVTPEVEGAIERARGGGQSLDSSVRRKMETAFGAGFEGVRVHTDARADDLNRAVNALAFTTGSDIFFRSGMYQPASSGGQELLAHELTHVVQQGAASVMLGRGEGTQIQRMCLACESKNNEEKRGIQFRLAVGAPNDEFEQEADKVARVVTGSLDLTNGTVESSMPQLVLQRQCACGGEHDQEQDECEECKANRASSAPAARVHELDFLAFTEQLQRSTARLREEDEGDTDTDPDSEFLYQNGTTTCSLPGGTPSTVINNTNCSRPCTVRHEGVHAADIGPCCARAGAAFDAAASDADRASVRSRFFAWLSGNRTWFECRGYTESVKCADEMLTANNCDSQSSQCCSDLTAYRASMEASRAANCAGAGSLGPCPF